MVGRLVSGRRDHAEPLHTDGLAGVRLVAVIPVDRERQRAHHAAGGPSRGLGMSGRQHGQTARPALAGLLRGAGEPARELGESEVLARAQAVERDHGAGRPRVRLRELLILPLEAAARGQALQGPPDPLGRPVRPRQHGRRLSLETAGRQEIRLRPLRGDDMNRCLHEIPLLEPMEISGAKSSSPPRSGPPYGIRNRSFSKEKRPSASASPMNDMSFLQMLQGPFNFLRPDPDEVRRLMPDFQRVLPIPRPIFLEDENATPLQGFPVLPLAGPPRLARRPAGLRGGRGRHPGRRAEARQPRRPGAQPGLGALRAPCSPWPSRTPPSPATAASIRPSSGSTTRSTWRACSRTCRGASCGATARSAAATATPSSTASSTGSSTASSPPSTTSCSASPAPPRRSRRSCSRAC